MEILDDDIEKIIKIQKIYRGKYIRKKLKKLKDNVTFELVLELIDNYNKNLKFNKYINNLLSKKKMRNYNYPEIISENIVKFALLKIYGICGCWDTDRGDLKFLNKQIEIKAFMSDGPSSFGPCENWDWLYFVDCKNTLEKKFKIYEIRLSNKNEIWRNIIVKGKYFDSTNVEELHTNINSLNKNDLKELCKKRGLKVGGNKTELIERLNTEELGNKFGKVTTIGMICDTGRGGTRPHISFEKIIKKQLKDNCKLIFDGHISELY